MAFRGKAAVVAFGLCASTQALAQAGAQAGQTPPPPSSTLPGRGQLENNRPADIAPHSSVQVDASGVIPPAPCALDTSNVHVQLTGLAITDPQGAPLPPRLVSLLAGVEDLASGDQPITVVCRVRDEINRRLSRAGYVALAQVPPQKIADGTLHMEVVTARIVEVRIVGDVGPFRKTLEKRIALIRELAPLNRHDAERILLETGDVPGLDVKLSLSSANAGPGEVIGTLTVSTKRFSLLGNIQNLGSNALGRWTGSLRAEAYGLTGLADRTALTYSQSSDWNEVRVVQASHDFALDSAGLRLGLRGSLAWSRPDIEQLDLRSRSVIAGLDLSMPLKRSLRETLAATAGFELLNQLSDIHASGTTLHLTEDRLRVAFARLDGDFRLTSSGREFARLTGDVQLRKGLSVFDASKLGAYTGTAAPSRLEGNPQAFVIRGEATAQLKPQGPFQLNLTGFGQWSNDPLLNLEEFSVGNFTRGRGYDPGSNGGDRVYGFTIEPRVRLPVPKFGLDTEVEASAFYDWLHLDNLDAGATETDRLLRSVGGGLRVMLARRMVLDLTYAHPLDKALLTDDAKPADRLLVSLTAKLF